MGNGVQGYGAHRQWGAGVWGTCMGKEVKGYGAQGYRAHVWAMRYKGMGHMGNGVQGYGAHRQWGTGCRGMGHMYGQ